jgi:hypothetical protein
VEACPAGHAEPELVVVIGAIVLVVSDAHPEAGRWVDPTPVEAHFAPWSRLAGLIVEF